MYISVVSLPVDDVDRAIDFYTSKLGWEKTMDEPMGDGTRWVTLAPAGGQTAFTLSTSARDPEQKTGGYSGAILEVDDVFAMHDALSKKGVAFKDEPSMMPWGGWASFIDSEGNVHGLHSPARG
jgi:predicted enzyme related to lactoylglutathione lyase